VTCSMAVHLRVNRPEVADSRPTAVAGHRPGGIDPFETVANDSFAARHLLGCIGNRYLGVVAISRTGAPSCFLPSTKTASHHEHQRRHEYSRVPRKKHREAVREIGGVPGGASGRKPLTLNSHEPIRRPADQA
jgi:hypothetical protein